MKRKVFNKKGFTIIELIVVIAIIAVLASIVLVNVTAYIQKSKETAVLAEFKQILVIATGYFSENGSMINFHQSDELKKISNSIYNIYPPYYLSVIEESGYTNFVAGVGATHNDGSVRSCSGGKWYATVYSYPNSFLPYCIDNTGNIYDSHSETECACNH
jgi:prepilin-type N-terminal cleavage/methylation domain-containing protein